MVVATVVTIIRRHLDQFLNEIINIRHAKAALEHRQRGDSKSVSICPAHKPRRRRRKSEHCSKIRISDFSFESFSITRFSLVSYFQVFNLFALANHPAPSDGMRRRLDDWKVVSWLARARIHGPKRMEENGLDDEVHRSLWASGGNSDDGGRSTLCTLQLIGARTEPVKHDDGLGFLQNKETQKTVSGFFRLPICPLGGQTGEP